jgi:hypothetical protein
MKEKTKRTEEKKINKQTNKRKKKRKLKTTKTERVNA